MVGGPRVFFDVIGIFQAQRLITDSKAQMAVVEAIVLDSVDSIRTSMQGIGEAFDGFIDAVVPAGVALSEAQIEFEKFAGTNKAIQQEIIETGAAMGFMAEDALAAGARMAQLTALIGEDATAAATELGQKFALISGMGTEEAMTRMINLQQQTKFMYGELTQAQFRLLSAEEQRNTVMGNTMETLDQLNTIENRSAASMKQITFVMNQFAAQADKTGESIANMAAMSAVLIEAGEEQGKAGRALRMIYARLGSNIQDNNDLLHKHGVATHDVVTGGLRPLSDVVADLSVAFEDMEEAEKQTIVQTVAGNDHYVRFVKLIDNAARVSELATGAIDDQSTAQEELNRVLEDNSTAYKKSQADIAHFRAEMGQNLLPIMTDMAERNLQLQKGFVSLGSVAGGLGNKIAAFTVEFQQYMKIAGGVFEMALNIKSVSIAMRTHQTVLRAVNGEELIRTDNYRAQGIFSGMTLSNQQQIALNANALGIIKGKNLLLEQQHGVVIEKSRTLQQMIVDGELQINKLLKESEVLLSSKRQKQIDIMMAMQQSQHYAEGEVAMLRGLAIQRNMMDKTQLATLEETLYQKRLSASATQDEIIKLEQLLYANARVTDASAIRHNNGLKAAKKGEMANAKEIADLQTILNEQVAMKAALESKAAAKERLAAIDAEMLMTLQLLEFSQKEMLLLTDQEIQSIYELSLAKDDLHNAEVVASADNLRGLIETRQRMMGTKQQAEATSMLKMSMSSLSMVAGMASMGFGMFGDSQTSATMSMVLMTMSMIPAMVQMGMMTVEMFLTARGANAAAFSIMGLNTALSITLALTGVGIAVIGIAYAIAKIVPAAEDVIGSVGAMNDTLKQTEALMGTMTKTEGAEFEVPTRLVDELGASFDLTTANANQLNLAIGHATREISDLKQQQLAFAQDDPMYSTLQEDINQMDLFKSSMKGMKNAIAGVNYEGLSDDDKIAKVLADMDAGVIEVMPSLMKPNGDPDDPYDLAQYTRTKTTRGDYYSHKSSANYIIEDYDELAKRITNGTVAISELTDRAREHILGFADASEYAGKNFWKPDEDGSIDGIDNVGQSFTEVEEQMRSFANAREELFFGGKSSAMAGSMMKQVVNKGVENLYSNVELLMTNNFYGLTMDEAISKISSEVTAQLISNGVPIQASGV